MATTFVCTGSRAIKVACEGLWQDLQRHVPVELRISRAIDLTHAAFAELGGDLIGAEGGAGGKRNGQFAGTRSFNSSNQFTAST